MPIVFVGVFVRMCLNSHHHLIVYEADSHIFNVILIPFHTLSALHLRVQTPTQSMAIEEDEELVKKVA
jgi:hypothetical protein